MIENIILFFSGKKNKTNSLAPISSPSQRVPVQSRPPREESCWDSPSVMNSVLPNHQLLLDYIHNSCTHRDSHRYVPLLVVDEVKPEKR